MAASGIAEHNEARRREVVYLRKAFLLREQKKAFGDSMLPPCDRPSSTYDQQVYSQGGRHDAASIDTQRRQDHYRQAQQEYSAKIQNRYSSLDYISQW